MIRLHLRTVTLISALLLFALSASCRSGRSTNTQHYELKGRVVSVDKSARRVTVAHEEVRGYMGAMVMPFALKDEWAFEDILPGDEIGATLAVDGKSSWLEDLVISRQRAGATPTSNTTAEPKPGDEVPDFSLVNQDGRPVHFKQYRGRTLLVTFIYTRCPLPDYCTLMSENFAEVEKEMKKDRGLYARTHLLSVSFDPEYDTPKVLRSYGAAHTGNYTSETFEHWEFATGKKEEVKSAARFFGLEYFQQTGEIVHSLRTAVIKPDGKLYKIYRGNEWKPAELVQDVKDLSGGDGR
ncbi:MAG TPA: SCO family protein [Pyrinomonadaceae bacterium]|jgi:protein SCO1/2